jgi:iron complex outermembrane receptor protein
MLSGWNINDTLQRLGLVCLMGWQSALAADADVDALEEILVHATRIPVEWTRTPVAVGWVDEDDIQLGRQQLGLDESLVSIPGLFFQNRYNFAQDLRVSIRGFGARSNFGIRGIKLFSDDIPLTMPDGQGNVDSIDLGSAQSIEVIRGAVSAAYGAAGGGVISIRTQDGPETPFVSGRLSLGSYDYQLAQAKAGGQSGRLNWFLNVSDTRLDGYRDHARYERGLLNSKFRYEFADDSSLTLVFNAVDSPMAQDPGALNSGELSSNRRQAAPRNILYDADEGVEQQKLGLAWRKSVNDENSFLLRAYGIQRDFWNRLPFDINSNGQGGSVDLSRKVSGLGGHWSWDKGLAGGGSNRLLLGFDLDAQRDLRKRFANNQGVLGELTTLQDEDVSSNSLYIEDVWSWSDHWMLTAGARLDDMTYKVTDRTQTGGSGKSGITEVSPMVGLTWSRDEALNVYANLSTAFDPPTITELANPNGPSGFNQDLGPQTANNYELGAKGLLSGRLRYELAAFHIEVKDGIVPFELEGSGQSFFENAGRSTHDGMEAGLTMEFLPGLSGSVVYTWSDFTFKDFVDLNGNDFAGNHIPGIPEHQFHLDLKWQHSSGFYAAWDLLYVGTFFANNSNTVKTDKYVVSNLRAAYRWSSGNWSLEPFIGVNNLFDEEYMGNIRINASFGRYYEPAPERNVYGGLELQFGF